MTTICPVCGEGHLHEEVEARELEHNEKRERINGFVFSICDSCGTEVTNNEQSRNNKRLVLAFRKKAEGLLTGQEIKAIRDKLSLSQRDAATIFGGGVVAFSKYENDAVSQSIAMDRLLRLASAIPAAFNWLCNFVDYQSTSFSLEENFLWDSSDSRRSTKKIEAQEYIQDISYTYEETIEPANMDDWENAA